MKKSFSILFAILLSAVLFGQQIEELQPLTKKGYLKKSKRQVTAGTISLCGGLSLYAVACVMALRHSADDLGRGIGRVIDPQNPPPPRKNDKGVITALLITGTAGVISGISFFESARKNRRNALDVSFKPEKTLQLNSIGLSTRMIPSVSFKLNI
jgi:hypothetical protein